jgi:hydroxyacylglutathione hydrolase
MPQEITILSLPLPLRMGMVNCYLLRTAAGCVLIDTGGANARRELHGRLESVGCMPGGLHLVLLTHGDFDHIGNVAHLRSAFGLPIAMGRADAAMAERGDMFAGRKRPNVLVRTLVPLLTGFGASERFTPDILLDDGCDLSPHGLDAQVIGLPGHSRGSIGILTAAGELFCGDLFENTKGPMLSSLIDDPAAAQASLSKLQALEITKVYPGHGRPFAMEMLAWGTPQSKIGVVPHCHSERPSPERSTAQPKQRRVSAIPFA